MPVHPPIVRRFVPPAQEQIAESRSEAEKIRADAQAEREASRPARRAALATGPGLRDIESALECHCSCHPRPADAELHDGGVSCLCQDTAEQRKDRREVRVESLAVLRDGSADAAQRRQDDQRRFAATAAELEAQARIVVSAAPFVIVGNCDGRGFYLRERHGTYRVTISADEDPSADPWSADPTATSIDIAEGGEHEFWIDGEFSEVAALRIAVAAVRTALARNTCSHRTMGAEPYCPGCGVRLSEAGQWRWTEPT